MRWARLRTSSATTAKPRPASPARAASIAAFSASRLVCWATDLITSRTLPILSLSRLSSPMASVECADFQGQALDLGDRFSHHLVAFTGLLVGRDGGLGGLFGVARDFLHGGGHFIHGGRHLVGLDLLAVHPGAGLLGHRRQLFGGAGDLGHAVTDTADQFAQGGAHALDALLQHRPAHRGG